MFNYKYDPADKEKSILDLLYEAGAPLPPTPCAGTGKCGKCRVRIISGSLSEPTPQELELLGEFAEKGFRLACMTYPTGDFCCEYESGDNLNIETSTNNCTFKTDGAEGTALAVDLGTTTVALYIADRKTGEIKEKISYVNPGTAHGADVISRINYALEGNGEKLRSELTESIKNALAERAFAPDYAVICGNTVMQHFITGLDTKGLSALPFEAESLFGKEHTFDFCKKTYLAPCVASYVGGDITVGAAAANADRAEELTLYIDIGTNGEIVLCDKDRILCCAAAAGPAFEGAGIECGMNASPGAISRVYIENGELKYETIGNMPPKGICGSGLLDAAACLLELELLDESGLLEDERVYFSENVYISRKDIRALQLAKAAIAAGVGTLLYEMKKKPRDIKSVLLAGGFGTHLNGESARRIGLIPPDAGEIKYMGNCAGTGALQCALSRGFIKRCEELCSRMEYVELSLSKTFNKLYVDNMFFDCED